MKSHSCLLNCFNVIIYSVLGAFIIIFGTFIVILGAFSIILGAFNIILEYNAKNTKYNDLKHWPLSRMLNSIEYNIKSIEYNAECTEYNDESTKYNDKSTKYNARSTEYNNIEPLKTAMAFHRVLF